MLNRVADKEILSVRVFGDGIFIEFADGTGGFFSRAYFDSPDPAESHLFVDYDPSELQPATDMVQ